jgi:uncharacterized protein (DUF2141 family)
MFLAVFLLASVLTRAQQIPVTITVKNVHIGKGSVLVNLYASQESFFKKACLTQSKKASNETLTFAFEIPEGTYAISIFQDMDNDGILKQGWFKIPAEPIGLGNNYKPKFSAPTFEACAVTISESNNQFTILLN